MDVLRNSDRNTGERKYSTRFDPHADAHAAYALLRVTLGLNICLHGLVRWHAGIGTFAASLTKMFAMTPLPAWMVQAFGYGLPLLETVIGAMLLLGFETRHALIAGMLLMCALTFGTALREDWQVAGLQLLYSVVYAGLLATVRFDAYAVGLLSELLPIKK